MERWDANVEPDWEVNESRTPDIEPNLLRYFQAFSAS